MLVPENLSRFLLRLRADPIYGPVFDVFPKIKGTTLLAGRHDRDGFMIMITLVLIVYRPC